MTLMQCWFHLITPIVEFAFEYAFGYCKRMSVALRMTTNYSFCRFRFEIQRRSQEFDNFDLDICNEKTRSFLENRMLLF